MPADVVIRRFKGLNTIAPDFDGEPDQLIKAENVIFDSDGLMQARQGLHYRDSVDGTENDMVYLGTYDFFPSVRIFVSEESYYEWDGVNMNKLGVIAVSSGLRDGAGTVTLNITVNHPFAVGDSIRVDVATASFNGVHTVTAVGATTVTFVDAGPAEGSGAGTVTYRPLNIQDRGVHYDGKIYFADGKHVDNSNLRVTPGQVRSQYGALAMHADRLWFIRRDTQDSRLYFSAPGNPSSWPAANFIDVGPDTGVYPRGLRSFQNKLFIFRDGDTWVLETPGIPTTWVLRKFLDISCDANSHIEHDGAMYWTAQTGAYRFDGGSVEKISDPIQDIFDERRSSDLYGVPYSVYTTVYKDTWYVGLLMRNAFFGDDQLHRIMCFHTKLGYWTELITPLNDIEQNRFFRSMWSEDYGGDIHDGLTQGLYMTFGAFGLTPTAGFFVSTHDQHGNAVADFWLDQIGPSIVNIDYDIVIQTKYSDYGTAYDMKRCQDWMIEYRGDATVTLDQFDERESTVQTQFVGGSRSAPIAFTDGSRTVSTATLVGLPVGHGIRDGDYVIVDAADATYDEPEGTYVFDVGATTLSYTDGSGVDASSGPGTVILLPSQRVTRTKKARGIGYFRRLSLKLTVTGLDDVGFKLIGLQARMKNRGKSIVSEVHNPS